MAHSSFISVLLLLALWSPTALANLAHFMTCCSEVGIGQEVEVNTCSTQPCKLHRGEAYFVNVIFISDVWSKNNPALEHGIVLRVEIPSHIPQPDECKSGIKCPVEKDKIHNYLNKLPVMSEYPNIRLVVQWKLG